mgnify:CR=1 FL=1
MSVTVDKCTFSLGIRAPKHKNDVFRLTELIDPTVKTAAPQGVYADIQEFVQRMKNENVDIKQLGLVGRTKEKLLEELEAMYETL